MAYSNICDIYDLGNFKSECDFHSVRLYFKNNKLKSILLNNEEICNIQLYVKEKQSYITDINIFKILTNNSIDIDYDSEYKIIIKNNNFKNRIKVVTENKCENYMHKKHQIIDYMTYFDLVIFEALTEEEDINARDAIIDISLHKIQINNNNYFLAEVIYKWPFTGKNDATIDLFCQNKYPISIMCRTREMKEKYQIYSNKLIKSISVPISFDTRSKGELILNYYQPNSEQAVFILKKIINYNTSEVKYITQNYKCSCDAMNHLNKKISKDKTLPLEEELKFCNCFINKNKIEGFKIKESDLISKLNLCKYIVLDIKLFHTIIQYDDDYYDEDYNEEDDEDEDDD